MTAARRTYGNPSRFELEGGAVVLLEPSHAVPLVSFTICLRSGSTEDPAGKTGLSRIALRMIRRGCEGMTAEQIDFRIDTLGAEMGVDTSPSTVCIHTQVIARNLDVFVDLLARLLATPTFPEDELGKITRETVAELIEARDSNRVVAQKALQRALFAGHPYGRNPGGTIADIEAIRRDDVLAYYKRFVAQKNIVVAIAGDVTADRAPELVRRILAGLPKGEAVLDSVPEPSMPVGRRLLVVDKPDRTQTQILVSTLGTHGHDEDHVPLVVANAVFGGTFTSRLMREVRSKRGWSYGASARTVLDRRRQAWVMWTFPAATDAAACLKLTLELMATWVSEGVTPREVAFIQRYLIRSHAFDIDTAAKRVSQTLDVELLGLPADYYSEWTDHVRDVTPEQASQAVRRRIDPSRILAVVVGTASQVLDPLKAAMSDVTEVSVVPFDLE